MYFTNNYYTSNVCYRVLKQTLRASGPNLTQHHMQNASLCTLFLLNACKRSDKQLKVNQTTHHTVRSATGDIQTMAIYMLGEKVTGEHRSTEVKFEDPLTLGSQKKVPQGLFKSSSTD